MHRKHASQGQGAHHGMPSSSNSRDRNGLGPMNIDTSRAFVVSALVAQLDAAPSWVVGHTSLGRCVKPISFPSMPDQALAITEGEDKLDPSYSHHQPGTNDPFKIGQHDEAEPCSSMASTLSDSAGAGIEPPPGPPLEPLRPAVEPRVVTLVQCLSHRHASLT